MTAQGRAVLLAARDGLEAVLLSLVEIPQSFDREDLRIRLTRGIHDVYVALDTSELALAHLEAIHEIAAIATEVGFIARRIAVEGEEPAVDRAIARLAAIERAARAHGERIGEGQLAQRDALELGSIADTLPPQRPFRASKGLPEVHAPPRGRLRAHVDVGANPPPRAPALKSTPTLAELSRIVEAIEAGDGEVEPEPPLGPEPDPGTVFEPAIEEVEVVRRWARDAIEDVAMHRALRKPNPLETWQDQAKFEQFILDNLDLLAALGAAALPSILLHHAEADAPDPERAFAVALVLGSIEGADTVFSAVMTLKQSPPEELPGWAEGFRLAASPLVDAALADLVAGEGVDLAVMALEVLALRGALDDGLIQRALRRSEPEIRVVMGRVLAVAGGAVIAVPALEGLLAATEDLGEKLVVLESLLARGHEPARLALRRLAPSSPPGQRRRAIELLCLAGGASDVELIVEELARPTDAMFVRSVGRFGHLATLPALLDLLSSKDDGVPLAASEALERITASGLFEEVEEPWDFDLPPEALEVPGAAPVPLRKVRRVVTDEKTWRERISVLRPSLDPRLRHRAGRPFTPSLVIDELAALTTPVEERDQAARELPLALGRAAPFDPHDWVARQISSIAALRAALPAPRPGAWPDGASVRTASSPAIRSPFASQPELVDAAPMSAAPSPGALPVPSFLLRPPPPAAPEDRSPRDDLSGTQMSGSPFAGVPRAALPFPSEPPVGPAPTGATPPRSRPPPPPLAPAGAGRSTMIDSDPPARGDALPFGKKLHATMAGEALGGPALPFAARSEPRLNLLQYATLCAEARHDPRTAEATFARFGLADFEARAREDALWRERLAKSPKDHAMWERLVEGLLKTLRPR